MRPVDGGIAIPMIPHLDAAPSGTARDTAPPAARRPAPTMDAAETGRVRFGSQCEVSAASSEVGVSAVRQAPRGRPRASADSGSLKTG